MDNNEYAWCSSRFLPKGQRGVFFYQYMKYERMQFMKYSVEKCAIILIIMNCNWITVEGTSVTVDFKKALLKRMTSSKQTFFFFYCFFFTCSVRLLSKQIRASYSNFLQNEWLSSVSPTDIVRCQSVFNL